MASKADIESSEIEQLRIKFSSAINNCKEVFGENIFKNITLDKPKQGMIYYDLLMVTVGLLDSTVVLKKKNQINEAYINFCQSDEFKRTLSGGLQMKSSILKRRELWEAFLNDAIQ